MTKRAALLLILAVLALSAFALDYLRTRSSAHLALRLARLGPGTPLAAYQQEFGPALVHQTTPALIEKWGTSIDPTLFQTTELYCFAHRGLLHSHVLVYINKTTQNSTYVTWRSM